MNRNVRFVLIFSNPDEKNICQLYKVENSSVGAVELLSFLDKRDGSIILSQILPRADFVPCETVVGDVGDSQLVIREIENILEKFDDKKFIHFFIKQQPGNDGKATLSGIEFIRFGLRLNVRRNDQNRDGAVITKE